MATKKKTATKKKVAKKVTSRKQELVIKVETQPAIPVLRTDDLVPQVSGSKFMLPKTWMSEKMAVHLVQRTDPKYVLKRPGKGGQTFDYVPGAYIIKVLNFVFGWNWDFEVVREGKEQDQIWVLGKLTVKDDHGHTIVKMQYGRSEIKFLKGTKNYVDYGNDMKSAATDSMKKCASELGIAADIYGKMEIKQDTGFNVKDDVTNTQGSVKGPDGSPVWLCSNCDVIIDKPVYDYSLKMFKKALCRDCQKNIKHK